MDEIINAFGIDVRLIIIQIVNFTILMVALGYFLYKPILKLLKEREEKIAQGIKDAELAASAKAEADSEKQVVLSAAHGEASAIASRAKTAAEAKTADILSAAQAKATQVLKEAEAKSEQLKKQALAESEKEVAELAILATEKVLREKAG
ncbi:MAG: ATP synthase subunit b, sodium ion specific [Syntrophomonadaceae bacterium]|nr:ATP synthase subunit b, sodium ion specific [Bacillota bacterium]